MKRNAISTNTRLSSLCLLPGLCLAALCLTFSAEAVMKAPTLTVTGQLVRLDQSTNPPVIELSVDGVTASGPLAEFCRFMDDRGNDITRDLFFRRYLKRVITVEILEQSGEVVSCRVGS
jgi:hypothetical protein